MYEPRVGRRFGRLTVGEIFERAPKGRGDHIYTCRCDCGAEKNIRWTNLTRGDTKSCGCLKASLRKPKAPPGPPREDKHSRHPLRQTWRNMMGRCYDRTRPKYAHYGAKGITVCDRWHDFLLFVEDMGPRPDGDTLDRIDPAGPYSPENCRWADEETQVCNKLDGKIYTYLTIRGVRKSVEGWAKKFAVDGDRVREDIRRGESPLVALLAAVGRKASHAAGKRTQADWDACHAAAVKKAAELSVT